MVSATIRMHNRGEKHMLGMMEGGPWSYETIKNTTNSK